ncbi:MAG: hypothetical protein A2Z83_07240 [Omnitrophica bacterium GWA2_52_8]|nr:MAG: hypothetical protein A2Z83_07240 [Omnitrophica bacterium GWA2_52_8]
MKEIESFLEKIERIMQGQGQYKFEAYSFIMAALHYTVTKLDKPRHVTGAELLDGVRRYALDQYGALARMVLNYWGIYETLDFGKIVFALVEVGILRKQPNDKIEDFKDVYNFEQAFDAGYKIEDKDEP